MDKKSKTEIINSIEREGLKLNTDNRLSRDILIKIYDTLKEKSNIINHNDLQINKLNESIKKLTVEKTDALRQLKCEDFMSKQIIDKFCSSLDEKDEEIYMLRYKLNIADEEKVKEITTLQSKLNKLDEEMKKFREKRYKKKHKKKQSYEINTPPSYEEAISI